MEDFRARRAEEAKKRKWEPGLAWNYKVDGRMAKCCRLRESTGDAEKGKASEVRKVIIGDTGFADDTAILGREDEVKVAEAILAQTMADWGERLHPDKTERLRMSGTRRVLTDVRGPGEKAEVRNVGGWVSEKCGHGKDTLHRVWRGHLMVRKIAKAWSVGSKRGRGRESGLGITTRLQVMKQTVVPVVMSFARSRSWNKKELGQIERVARYAVRRAMGMDIYAMREHHVSDEALYKAAGWNTMADTLRRLTLEWVGHIARMPTSRRPKQMLFGWWAGHASKKRFGVILQPIWLRRVVREAGVPLIDWFRVAQDRKEWRKIVDRACPRAGLTEEQRVELERWRPGLPLPGATQEVMAAERARGESEGEGSEEEGTAMQRGREGQYVCPACKTEFGAGNQLQFHYDAEHAVRDPDLVTMLSRQCELCRMVFARQHQLYKHRGWKLNWATEPNAEPCEAREVAETRGVGTKAKWYPVRQGPELPAPAGWWMSTDGSAQVVRGEKIAGWGVAVWRIPIRGDVPEFLLYGPVLTKMWDHRWLGAREKTNNVAELSAIGEGMLWLLQEAPDGGHEPVMLRYDSEYAANIAMGRYEPEANQELAEVVRDLTTQVAKRRVISWQHVYGHTGQVDNETADRAADRGARG